MDLLFHIGRYFQLIRETFTRPERLATTVIEQAAVHHGWEDFSRERLSEGGELRRYYPLSDEARPEYEAWLVARARAAKKT